MNSTTVLHTINCETGELDAVGDAAIAQMEVHAYCVIRVLALYREAHGAGLKPVLSRDVNSSLSVTVSGTVDELEPVMAALVGRFGDNAAYGYALLGDASDAEGFAWLDDNYAAIVWDSYLMPA